MRLAWHHYFVSLALLLGGAAAQADWQGRIEEREGVRHIYNPATPLAGRLDVHLTHLWTVGTEDDEEIFGNIVAAAHDATGNVYVLDSQLVSARAFTPEGDLLGEYGRQGEGPGEYQRPREILALPDGLLAISDSRPPKIVRYQLDGTPAGDIALSGLNPSDGGFLSANGLVVAGDRFAAELRHMVRDENARVMKLWVAAITPDGGPLHTYFAREETTEFGQMVMTDKSETFDGGFWTLDATGSAYARLKRDLYEVGCYGADGSLERVIHRGNLIGRERTAAELIALEERSANRPRGGRRRHGNFTFEFDFAKTRPLITGLWIGPDGNLWIRDDDHRRALPDGAVEHLAIFDAAGRYLHEVLLYADPPIHPRRIFHSGPYVITFGEGEPSETAIDPLSEELEPGDVIPTVSCYRMEF